MTLENLIGNGASTALSVIGILGTPLVIQGFRGKWPFYKEKENVWTITQNILGQPSQALRGAGTYFDPLYRIWKKPVKNENGEKIQYKMTTDEIIMNSFQFTTIDGLQGTLHDAAFRYHFGDKIGVNNFYWKIGGDINEIDNKVRTVLTDLIGRSPGKILAGILNEISNYATIYLNNQLKENNSSDKDALINLGIIQKNEKTSYQDNLHDRLGVILNSITLGQPEFTEESRKILSKELEAEENAKADIINARKEEIERKLFANAQTNLYREIYNSLKEQNNSNDMGLTNEELKKRAEKIADQIHTENLAQSGMTTYVNIDFGKNK